MALGKKKQEQELLIKHLKKVIEDDNRMLSEQNKEIVRLQEELKHAKSLLGLYEACLITGTKIDFPDVTGKGGNAVNSGDIDFSDF